VTQTVLSPQRVLVVDDEPEVLASLRDARELTLRQSEESYVRRLMGRHRGTLAAAARDAGKDRQSFWRVTKRCGIDPSDFRGTANR